MNPQETYPIGRFALGGLRCPTMLVVLCLAIGTLFCSCKADLVVKNIRHEQITTPNLVMKATIKNQGMKPAGASTADLSTRYGLSGAFTQISRTQTPPLSPGQEVDVPVWIFPPTSLPDPGQCLQAKVCADVDDVVRETSNANNCLTQSFGNSRYCRSCDLCCKEALPVSFDWRNRQGTNWVTGVRDQANCGSCWAFSAVAAVEAKNNVEREASQQSPIDLSEQELVSCPGGGGSCLGGWPSTALNYIRTTGIVGEATLTYTSINCLTNSGNSLGCLAACSSATISGCANPLLTAVQCAALDNPATPGGTNPPSWRIGSGTSVTGNSGDDIKRALSCHGPISVCGTWYVDGNGVGHGHCVLLVGWDTIGWIFKNSWGIGYTSGGQGAGYGRVPFSGHTFSNIVNQAWYAQDVTRRP